MRISIPIDIWDPTRGGAERYLQRLSLELAGRGHEVTVMCIERRGGETGGGRGQDTATPVPRVEILDVPRHPRSLRELAFARESVRAHRRAGRDVLFAVRHALEADVYQPHGGSLRAARTAAGLSLPRGRRLARDLLAGLRPSLRVLLWLDREVFRRSPRLITISVSEKVETDFRRLYPGLEFRFERLYNPVDAERFHDRDRGECAARLRSSFGIPPTDRVALFAAHRFRPKGLGHALAALAATPGWHLIVAGRDRPPPFARAAGRLGVAARCHFAGAIGDLRPFYAGAEAFVLPTYYDPCSLAALEAMACGAPVITTRQNGAAELIRHAVSGFVVDRPEDVGALAAALRESGERWEHLHDAARHAAAGWGWDAHVDRLEAILESRRAPADRTPDARR